MDKTLCKLCIQIFFVYIIVTIPLQSLVAKNVMITDFGAVADSTTLNTVAIQKAIDICAETGGGVVTVPSGIFLTGAINLRSHVELYLNRGAVIRGSLRIPEDYPHRALIYAENIEDAGISGNGIIDGYSNHPSYKERFRVNDGKRPRGIFFNHCKRMSLRDFHIRNAGSWTVRLLGCDGVNINGISIYCLTQGNNDGIDVDAKNVTISNCNISCDDDGICLKSDLRDFMPENITVTNCVIASNCNPIKLGTSSYSGFRNVVFSNCVVRRTEESVIWDWGKEYRKVISGTHTGLSGITVQSVDGGIVENISFNNIIMEGIITPIFVCLNHRHGDSGIIRNLQFNNITAKADGIIPCLISGVPGSRIEGITLRDIIVEHEGGEEAMSERLPENLKGYPENRMYGPRNPAGGLYIRHADNIIVDNFQIRQRNIDYRPAIVLDDVTDFRMRNLKAVGIKSDKMVQAIDSKSIIIDE